MTKTKILEQIKYWTEVFKPVNNMGKWWAQTQIDRWTKKLEQHENKKNNHERKKTGQGQIIQEVAPITKENHESADVLSRGRKDQSKGSQRKETNRKNKG